MSSVAFRNYHNLFPLNRYVSLSFRGNHRFCSSDDSNLASRNPPSRPGRTMGANASRRVNTRASSGDMNLSDGCKGAPIPDGVKLPIMCGEEVMSQKVRIDPAWQHVRENADALIREKYFKLTPPPSFPPSYRLTAPRRYVARYKHPRAIMSPCSFTTPTTRCDENFRVAAARFCSCWSPPPILI